LNRAELTARADAGCTAAAWRWRWTLRDRPAPRPPTTTSSRGRQTELPSKSTSSFVAALEHLVDVTIAWLRGFRAYASPGNDATIYEAFLGLATCRITYRQSNAFVMPS